MEIDFNHIVSRLSGKVSSPRLEARLMIGAVLNQDADSLPLGKLELTAEQYQVLMRLIEQRLAHWPLDKLLRHKDFYKYNFYVDSNVLSPRPDTEILVEQAASILASHPEFGSVLDLGTGSGCILLSLLADFPHLCGVGVDASASALQVAKQNAAALGVSARVDFLHLDWFAADFAARLGRKFALITSNPPYIPSQDIASLDDEVKNHDPLSALDGGADGFDSYRRQAELAPELLQDGGYILLEGGIGQHEQIASVFIQAGLTHISTVPDLAGIPRCIILQKQ